MPDFDEQLNDWEPMIHYVIRTLHIHPNEIDDCAQAGRIALWRALLGEKTLSKTYCFIRVRGAILNHRAKQKKTLVHEVTCEHLPETGQSPLPFQLWLSDQENSLPPRHYALLCHMLCGTEDTLGYSPSRLRAYRAELYRMLREDTN